MLWENFHGELSPHRSGARGFAGLFVVRKIIETHNSVYKQAKTMYMLKFQA